jgi:hypothetical protein
MATDRKSVAPAEMTELDEAWDLALAEAKNRARASGRRDIAAYLDLRRQNDLLRRTATDWLINAAVLLAGKANRAGAGIQIEQDDTHRFARGTATMVGKRITLRKGVRAMTLESGWPRTPRDGIVRGGGLACANIKHFGRPRLNEELLLIRSSKGSPHWYVTRKNEGRSILSESHLKHHLSILTEP